jgi:hypothetical protein
VYSYQLASWTVFLSVAAGVSATLTGLIFVAISINLNRILEFPNLVDRAAESILQILGALIVSIWALAPGKSNLVFGVELALAGAVLWSMQTLLQYRSFSREFPRPIVSIVFSQLATVSFCLAGISLATGTLGGLNWLAPAVIASITMGVANTWVLLVEILR